MTPRIPLLLARAVCDFITDWTACLTGPISVQPDKAGDRLDPERQ